MIRTIIVDDEPASLAEMKSFIIDEKGFVIIGAYTEPLKAINDAGEIKPDCAFLDIKMAGMSGIDLAERLASINPDIDIVFITAYNNYATQAFEVNAIDYLLKPVRAERLKMTVEKLLKKRGSICSDNTMCIIRSFGSFEVSVENHIIKWNRSKPKEVFALLLQWQGKSISKYRLCELLWPRFSQEQALAYLQTSIWAIRKSFRDIGFEGVKIEYHDDRYSVKIDRVDWDTMEFEKHYQDYRKSGSKEAAETALSYYTGEYLEDESWLWAYPDRERYRRMYKELVRNI